MFNVQQFVDWSCHIFSMDLGLGSMIILVDYFLKARSIGDEFIASHDLDYAFTA